MAPPRKYNFNTAFFRNIDQEDKAYFLGLLAADGWLEYNGKFLRGVAIALNDSDMAILQEFREALGGNTPLMRLRETVTSYGNNASARLTLRSAELARDLVAKGFTRNKSAELGPLSLYVPQVLWPHLVRGLMDGNGGPVIETHSLANGKPRLRWSLRGTLALLEDVQMMIPVTTSLFTKSQHPKLYTSSQDEALALTRWLYEDATIYLKRKHWKVLSALMR